MQRSRALTFTLITSILNVLYGLTFSAVSLISMATMEQPDTSGASTGEQIGANLGYGLGTAILLILAIIAGIYTVVALIPMITKIFQARRGGGRGASIFCILFDLLFALANATLSLTLFTGDGDPIAYVIATVAAIFTVLPIINLICNVKIIRE
jgi:hypothetical protein